jgi:tetratricopeptide (TPR) repeat protein
MMEPTSHTKFRFQLQLEEANTAFDRVFELRSDAYLWQAGIVKFYLGELEEAADIFARNAATFESKFGGLASEERIWLDACKFKFLNSIPRLERKYLEDNGGTSGLLRSIPEMESGEILSLETRKVIKITRDLFSASVDSDLSGELLARAKLRSMGGSENKNPKFDRKMWKLNSWFYLGLHYDTKGETEESKKCMKMALKLCPSSGKSDDIIHTLPLLHMSVRDWFDDDDFEEDPLAKGSLDNDDTGFSPAQPSYPVASIAYADPLIEASIKDGVAKMRMSELREALRLRGLTSVGSKESLRERLFYSLMDDTGFNSRFAP